MSLKKMFGDNSVWTVVGVLAISYVGYIVLGNLSRKGSGSENMTAKSNASYSNAPAGMGSSVSGPVPSDPSGQNEVFSSVKGGPHQMPVPMSGGGCSGSSIQNPADLLPLDNNSQWSQLNPTGQGMLGSINLLKAGQLMGVDTIGSSMRNANLQLRSEPANPIVPGISVWNASSITHDQYRPTFEVNNGHHE